MTFWLLAGALAALVTAILVRGLLAPVSGSAERRSHDLTVYRDQLDEVGRDRDRGLLSDEEAAAARVEIERRILALGPAAEADAAAPAVPVRGRWRALLVALLVPTVSLSLYLVLGSPAIESLPFAERPGQDGQGGTDLASLATQLRDRLAQVPDDDQAWVLLGHLERRAGNEEAASAAYRRALEANPENNGARISLAETLVAVAQGAVERDARLLFAEALRRDPASTSARYYAGLAMVQDGLLKPALDVWVGLLRDSPPTAAWVPMVRQQVTELAESLELDPASVLEQSTPESGPGTGPSAADVEAAEAMSAEERGALIRSMVAQLAERLAEDPDDLQGWLRLARSYGVLGETRKAHQALAQARGLVAELPEDAPQRLAVEALAERLSGQP